MVKWLTGMILRENLPETIGFTIQNDCFLQMSL